MLHVAAVVVRQWYSDSEVTRTAVRENNNTNLMTCDVVVQMLMAVVTELLMTEAVVLEFSLTVMVVVQFEFALLSGHAPQWDSSGHLLLPAK